MINKKRSILLAQENGENLPDLVLNFPPGYLDVNIKMPYLFFINSLNKKKILLIIIIIKYVK